VDVVEQVVPAVASLGVVAVDAEHPEDGEALATAADAVDRAADFPAAAAASVAAAVSRGEAVVEAAVVEVVSVDVDAAATRPCRWRLSDLKAAGRLREICEKDFYRYHDLFSALLGLDGVYIVKLSRALHWMMAIWTAINLLEKSKHRKHFTLCPRLVIPDSS
jgi:hypothetical protein